MEECDLRGVRKITEASLTKFVYEARKLKKLDVRGCQGTTICVSSQFISMYVSSHCILKLDVGGLLSLSLFSEFYWLTTLLHLFLGVSSEALENIGRSLTNCVFVYSHVN